MMNTMTTSEMAIHTLIARGGVEHKTIYLGRDARGRVAVLHVESDRRSPVESPVTTVDLEPTISASGVTAKATARKKAARKARRKNRK